jgi:hypothetical protein
MELINLFRSGTGWYRTCYRYACQHLASVNPGVANKCTQIRWGEMVEFTYKTAEGCTVTRYVESQKLAFYIVESFYLVNRRPPNELPPNLFSLVHAAIQGVYERSIWATFGVLGMNCGHHKWWNSRLLVPARTFHMWTPEQCTSLSELVEHYRAHPHNVRICAGCKLCRRG